MRARRDSADRITKNLERYDREIREVLSRTLEDLRARNGLSMKDMGAIVGISASHYSRLISPKNTVMPRLAWLKLWADAGGESFGYLLTGTHIELTPLLASCVNRIAEMHPDIQHLALALLGNLRDLVPRPELLDSETAGGALKAGEPL